MLVCARVIAAINSSLDPGVRHSCPLIMSSIPSITEWIDTALTAVAVRPEFRDNLREELEQWLVKAIAVQVSPCEFCWGVYLLISHM